MITDQTPAHLAAMLPAVTYKPGWTFRLVTGPMFSTGRAYLDAQATTSAGMPICLPPVPVTLLIEVRTADSDTGQTVLITHPFTVPPWPMAEGATWARWLLDRIIDVERHEAMEFYQLAGHRPFPPAHGPGVNSYTIPKVPAGV
jgi:hypothetical protein